MDYITALRGRRALVATGITLAVLFGINAIIRFSTGLTFHFTTSFTSLSQSKGSVTTHTVLPDGAKETIIVNKRLGRRVTIVDRGYRGGVIMVSTSPVTGKEKPVKASGPFFNERKSIAGKTYTKEMRFGGPIDIGYFWYAALVVGFILATVLSRSFSSENDGHLEMSFMRPQSRVVLGFRSIATDILTILIAEIMTVVFALAAVGMYIEVIPTLSGLTLATIALNLLAPIAWYALLLAATASLRGGRGLVVGLAWPVAFIVPAIFIGTEKTLLPLGQAVHALLFPLVWLDPLWYMQKFSLTPKTVSLGVSLGNAIPPALVGLALVAALYLAVAVLQWRRMEA